MIPRKKGQPEAKNSRPAAKLLPTKTVQMKTLPAAPPVYRPNPVARVLQKKTATAPRTQVVPYRPQPIPKVLQPKVIQRNINSTNFEKSDRVDPLYMVNPRARRTLYSKTNAPPPKPTGLYTKKRDRDDATGRTVLAWTPNVRLLLPAEVDHGTEQSLKKLMEKVENPRDPQAERLPTFGILGKNDCTGFAETLYRAIASEHYRGEEELDAERSKVYKKGQYPRLRVGDQMTHRFTTGTCKWHGATVVAQDLTSEVTLEADVSKANLRAPEFYIRAGVKGFVKANIEANEGEKNKDIEVTKYRGGMPRAGDVRLYRTAKYKSHSHNALYQNVGSTRDRPLRPSEKSALRKLVNDPSWDSEGVAFIGSKTPDGVEKMRLACAQGRYWDVFRIAWEKNRTADKRRSPAVQKLYNDLANIWERDQLILNPDELITEALRGQD